MNVTEVRAKNISLQWEPPEEPNSELQEYDLFIKPSNGRAIVNLIDTTYTITDLHPNTKYEFQIRFIGKNDLRSPYSNSLFVKTDISSKKICTMFGIEENISFVLLNPLACG